MKLTPKQEAFCLKFVEIGNASEAYRSAYNAEKMKHEGVAVNASKLLGSTKIALRVAELQEENKKRFEITVDTKKGWLVEVIERSLQHKKVGDTLSPDDEGELTEQGIYAFDGKAVISAITELNKMDGDHAPARNEHTGKDGKPIETVSTVVNRLNFLPVGNKG